MVAIMLSPRIIITVVIKIRVTMVKCKSMTLPIPGLSQPQKNVSKRKRQEIFISSFISNPA